MTEEQVHSTEGTQLILDLYGCTFDLTKTRELQSLVDLVLRKVKVQVRKQTKFHYSHTDESTWMYTLSCSSLVIHTWPSHKYIAFDFFTCDPQTDLDTIENKLLQKLQPQRVEKLVMDRGTGSIQHKHMSLELESQHAYVRCDATDE